MIFANFLHAQFGVQTMASQGGRFGGAALTSKSNQNRHLRRAHPQGQRDHRPAGQRHQTLRACPTSSTGSRSTSASPRAARADWGDQARDALARSTRTAGSTSRQRTPGRKAIAEYGPGQRIYRQKRLEQIVGNWGRFETGQRQPAGRSRPPSISASATATRSLRGPRHQGRQAPGRRKAYLQASPGQLDWERLNISNLGYRLVEQQQTAVPGRQGRRLGPGTEAAAGPRR